MQLDTFPFVIIGFHSDNGSEYINKNVAALLEKLHVEFTKSRPRHSNDNALAESKNGSIVRKLLGYMHIPQRWAEQMNEFNAKYLNPYVNYHRPCFFPEVEINDKGKERKIYRYDAMMTPYEKFKSLPNAIQFLREDLTFEKLDKRSKQISDNDAAKQLKNARSKLFNMIHENKQAV
jgi:transposase InsO family protein